MALAAEARVRAAGRPGHDGVVDGASASLTEPKLERLAAQSRRKVGGRDLARLVAGALGATTRRDPGRVPGRRDPVMGTGGTVCTALTKPLDISHDLRSSRARRS